jgi:hypothetical protein
MLCNTSKGETYNGDPPEGGDALGDGGQVIEELGWGKLRLGKISLG